MISFTKWLEVARWKRSSWPPPNNDAMQRLKKYKSGGYYATFTRMPDKLGINPVPLDDTTPYGVYAYPVPYVLARHITEVPLAGESPYIWVFKPKNPRRVIKISDRGDKAWQHWQNAYAYSGQDDYWNDSDEKPFKTGNINKYFRTKNIHGVVDQGTSTIHPNEPTQAVFFGSHNITPIEVIPNNYANKYVGAMFDHDPDTDEEYVKNSQV